MAFQNLANQLSNELNIAHTTIRELRFEIASLNDRLVSLASTPQARNTDGEVAKLKAQLEELQQQCATLSNERNAYAKEVATAESQLEQALGRHDGIESKLRGQLAELETEVSYQRTCSDGWRAQYHQLEKEHRKPLVSVSPLKNKQLKPLSSQKPMDPTHSISPPEHCDEDDDEEDLPQVGIKAEMLANAQASKTLRAHAEPAPALSKTLVSRPKPTANPSKPNQQRQRGIPFRTSPAQTSSSSGFKAGSKRKGIAEELLDLELVDAAYMVPKAKKRARTTAETVVKQDRHIVYENESTPFDFKLITGYPSVKHTGFGPNTEILTFESADLEGNVTELWDKVWDLVDTIEERAGGDWQWELEKQKGGKRQCVRSKFERKQTVWRAGDGGWFACSNCAGSDLPCFTWTGEEIWLLPLHEDDRRQPVKQGFEVRYWIDA